jgi:type I restriction enzyme S subunit
MTSEWHEVPLRELVGYISKGIAPSYAEEASETTIRVLNQKCNRNFRISYGDSRLHDTLKKKVPPERYVKPDDILINSTGAGTAGRIAQIEDVPSATTIDGHMILIRSNGKVTQKFLGYALKAHQWEVLQLDEGSTGQTELNRDRLLDEIMINYPVSFDEQNAIVGTLESIDRKLIVNEQLNDNLLEQASSIYQAWFEDFILSDGSCPPSWKQGTLAGIADITSGKRPPVKSAEKTDNAIIPIVGAASVMGYTTEANHTDKILVTGRVGTHGVVQRFNSPCWASDNTLVITSAFYEYTFQILQRIDYRTLNRGSTQPLITQGDMNKVPILIPDNETLLKFETLVGQLMKQYQVNLLENDKLAELRDALLPKLMSGEIDVSAVHF